MAKLETTIIEGLSYRLHSTKEKTYGKIGFVPVRDTDKLSEYQESYPDSIILRDAKHGCAIRLQAMARDCMSSDTFTDADYDRIAPTLLIGRETHYQGKWSLLRSDAEEVFRNESADREVDSEHIWVEFL